jgi:uncharacterized phage protein (TIGR02216 family)
MKPEAIPWPAMIAAAVRLGVTPAHFWRLSLREWRALIAPVGEGALSRAAFSALAQMHPDDLT